ncbi:MAG: NAD(P)H-dependent oxidoreductase [Syntrophobacteraceae bacterium]
MKVLALNSSPRAEGISKTGMLLDALTRGMREAGAEVEVVPLRKKKISNCIGCYTCWTKTPGVCVHKDDMTGELFPKWLAADIVVYATPLYHFTMNASMKAFIERTLPLLQPTIIRVDGRFSHPLRQKPPRSVVLSVAGFNDMAVFEELSRYVKFLFRNGLVAEIYRPGAEMLPWPEYAQIRESILQATTLAGREIVRSESVSPETMERITRPVVDSESFTLMANIFWQSCIREGVTPEEFKTRNMVPRPDSIETFLAVMARGFHPESAENVAAVIQFTFSGEVEGSCHFRIESGKIEARGGAAAAPNLVVESGFDTWMDVITGKADGQQLFLEQKYKASGDMMLLLRMKEFFGRD